MKNDNVKIYLEQSLTDKKDTLTFLYKCCDIEDFVSQKIFLENLEIREKQGSIEIANGVVLPHFESENLKGTQIIIIRPLNTIKNWSPKISKVDLLIALIYKTGDGFKEIQRLMKMLANDSFIEFLKHQDINEINQIIRSKLCK